MDSTGIGNAKLPRVEFLQISRNSRSWREVGKLFTLSLESCSTVEHLKNCHVDLFSLFLFSFLCLVEMFALISIELFANDISEKASRTSVSRLLRTPLEWIFAKRSYREQSGTKCRGKIGLCYSWLPICNVAFYSDIQAVKIWIRWINLSRR